MTDDELIARADANYFHAWRSLVACMDGAELFERDGLLLLATRLPAAEFNIAFVTRPSIDPDAAVECAAAWFDERSLPFIVRVRADVDASLERACEAHRLPYSDTVPGMALPTIDVLKPPQQQLAVRTVDDAASLAEYRAVLARGFEMPLEWAERFLSERVLGIVDARFYLGYLDGAPVATSALIASHRAAGVYNVAVVEEHRRRGLGEAMTAYAVRDGASMGCVMASLQSSDMGKPVYERMGFRTVAPYRTFHRA